ncbi:MAG: hypothetical protein RLZ81_111 [Pseudomonadota bacterium]|jgi:hypothetical protein
MSKFTITALIAAVALALPAWADDTHHPEKAAAGKAAPSAAATQPAQAVPKMRGNVKKMQAQLERIAKAPTDEARQKAIAEHMQTMHENMQMARGMQGPAMGCPMMDGAMMGKGMMHGEGGMMGKGGMGMMGSGAPADGAADPMQQMDKRMEMMQEMMKTLMERMPAPPAK